MKTKNAQHTPGPWVQDGGSATLVWGTRDGHDVLVSDCAVRGLSRARPTRDENLANARLIAAAPELLEALELMLGIEWATYEGNLDASGYVSVDDLNTARAALKKARGES